MRFRDHLWGFLWRAGLLAGGLFTLIEILPRIPGKNPTATKLVAVMNDNTVLLLLLCWILAAIVASWELRKKDRKAHEARHERSRDDKDHSRGTIRQQEQELKRIEAHAAAEAEARKNIEIANLEARVEELTGTQEYARAIRDVRKKFYDLSIAIDKAHPRGGKPLTGEERRSIDGLLSQLDAITKENHHFGIVADWARERLDEAGSTPSQGAMDQILGGIVHRLDSYVERLKTL